jgi:hypothetical protein
MRTSVTRPARVAPQLHALAVVQPPLGERVHVARDLGERVLEEPLDERVQTAVALEQEERVVVPPVLADDRAHARGRGRRLGHAHAAQRVGAGDDPVRHRAHALAVRQPVVDDQQALAERAQLDAHAAAQGEHVEPARLLEQVDRALARAVAPRERARPLRRDGPWSARRRAAAAPRAPRA